MRIRIALAAFLFVEVPLAHAGGTLLHGQLRDGDARPVPGGLVTVECSGDLPTHRALLTDDQGRWQIDDVPFGRCLLSAEVPGYQPLQRLAVEVDSAELRADLTMFPDEHPPPRLGPAADSQPFDGLPLPARTLRGALRGTHGTRRSYRLKGFDIGTDDSGVAPAHAEVPLDSMVAIEASPLASAADRAFRAGTPIDIHPRSGSNRMEASALLETDPLGTRATAIVAGPVTRDRAWYAASVEADRRSRGMASLAWMLNSRNKLTLLGLQDAALPDAGLLGAQYESLLTDSFIVDLQAGWCQGPQGSLRLQLFQERWLGEHAFQLAARVGRPGESNAHVVQLQDTWRIRRSLTIVPELVWAGEQPAGQGELIPQLGMAWDVTGDGRTALRAVVASDLLAIGAERELFAGVVASADLSSRTWLLGLRNREGPVRLDLSVTLPGQSRSAHLSRVAVGWAAHWAFAFSALVSHEGTWFAGVRARLELGRWLGFPLALYADALLGAMEAGAPGGRGALRTSY